jgi:hypothetical protein
MQKLTPEQNKIGVKNPKKKNVNSN